MADLRPLLGTASPFATLNYLFAMGQWDYTATPPGVTNYNTADAPTAAAPASSNPAALTNAAPASLNPSAPTNIAPGTYVWNGVPAAPIAAPANVTITLLTEAAVGLLGMIDSIAP